MKKRNKKRISVVVMLLCMSMMLICGARIGIQYYREYRIRLEHEKLLLEVKKPEIDLPEEIQKEEPQEDIKEEIPKEEEPTEETVPEKPEIPGDSGR